MTDAPRRKSFTVDDLTANEYGTLARLIGGDPSHAMANPSSVLGADALSGLAMIRDRRERSGVTWENYRDMTIRELQETLGLIGPADPVVSAEEVAQALAPQTGEPALTYADGTTTGEGDPVYGGAYAAGSPDDTAATAALVAGGPVDPSEQTGSPSSA